MKQLGTVFLLGSLALGCSPPTGSSQSGVPRAANPPAGTGVTVEETHREVSADADRAAEQQKREEYQRQFQAQMDKLNEQIKELGDRAATTGADAQVRLDRQLAELRQQQAELRKRWDAFRASAPGAWEEMKGGLERAYGELHRSFDRAAGELRTK